jgi:flavin reductase
MNERIDLFKLGMRRLAAGVSLITTRDETGIRHGMIATSVTSVCLSPPSLLSCINKSASCHDTLMASGVFCVNLLAEGDDAVAARFSSSKFRETRFDGGSWSVLETGAPVYGAALASFDCRVTASIEASSHTIFIGEVVAVSLRDHMASPLVYLDGAYARFAAP